MTASTRRVALVYTTTPGLLVATAIAAMQRDGAQVSLIGPQIKGYEDALTLVGEDNMVRLRWRSAPVPIDHDNPPKRYSAEWAWVVIRNLYRKGTYKPLKKVLSASVLWWRSIAQNRTALHHLDEADIITAVDGGAVYPVWQAARRNRRAVAINGVGPTLQHLGLADD